MNILYKYNNAKINHLIIIFIFSIISAQSPQDMQKLKSELDKFNRSSKQSSNEETLNVNEIEGGLPEENFLKTYSLSKEFQDSIKNENKYFGYNFFTLRDSIPFWENLPTPKNYILGPGDEIVILVWGQTQLRKTYTISRDGKIYDDKAGRLDLLGKTIKESEKYLINQFGRIYATLKGSRPTSYMDVSLGKLRSINVNFVGEVNYPGVHPIHPFSNIITGLIQAGGVDTLGSLRHIQIKREGGIAKTFDLYDYLLKGTLPDNIQLRDQDIVFLPTVQLRVEVDSAIARPGYYEAIKGETLKDIIDFSGGLKYNASPVFAYKRTIPIERRKDSENNYSYFYVDYKNSENFAVENGDKITIREMFKSVSQVEIIGQVKTPGVYYYYPGMRLKELMDLGGGFSDATFLKTIYLDRAEIVRRDPVTRYENVININLNDIILSKSSSNIELNNLDRFVVHSNRNFFKKENIKISGEVNIPGSYPLLNDNETLRSALIKSGGLTSKALPNGITIFRNAKYANIPNFQIEAAVNFSTQRNINDSRVVVAWRKDTILLAPGDSIVVRESTKSINIFGEVYNPGLIGFSKGKSLNYYINSAGGITDLGNKKGVIVIYANGVVAPKKWFNSPKIDDGSTIIINQKEMDQIFNLTQFATNWSSIISSMITAIVLSRQLN